ncbi:MAG: GNAT family N-acetyltransferase [Candidatus Eisenbacteria bacterium]|uniref:GNAT family N-acetyltransferase n=1 Tax=Eiseniibacteriota bacterium TaxID=2212470 RepID=A0A538TN62_UNCEI|nr:MAG: GNAT family N-acetyltransferase [Candidatus Eisenbacteria bacterium]TMQ65062.1 MAG: GNAT family N-acetyltransferase [Candidatus Eisenbacteria bacterium]
MRTGGLVIKPLTPGRWDDFKRLFETNSVCRGCWCMFWRLRGRAFSGGWGAKNRGAFRRRVKKGPAPGLIAYANAEPIGWCALAPREEYLKLEHSRVLHPVDDKQVWSIPCFFIAREHRGSGLTVKLLRAASDYARKRGVRLLEGYPTDTRGRRAADPWVYTGLLSAFEKAGFREVVRRSRSRPIVRRRLSGGRPPQRME